MGLLQQRAQLNKQHFHTGEITLPIAKDQGNS